MSINELYTVKLVKKDILHLIIRISVKKSFFLKMAAGGHLEFLLFFTSDPKNI